jgi:hypothetical protein
MSTWVAQPKRRLLLRTFTSGVMKSAVDDVTMKARARLQTMSDCSDGLHGLGGGMDCSAATGILWENHMVFPYDRERKGHIGMRDPSSCKERMMLLEGDDRYVGVEEDQLEIYHV